MVPNEFFQPAKTAFMLLKTKGIVLKSIKYGETSLIVEIFTEDRGIRKYIINGVRSAKAKSPASVLQVMSLVEIVAYENEQKELNRLKEVRPFYVYKSVPFEIRKGSIGLFIAEVCQKTIREQEPNPELFNFISETFQWLDETPHSVANLHLCFLIRLSVFLGFVPSGRYSPDLPFFDLIEGVFCRLPPGHVHYLLEDKSKLLDLLLATPILRSHDIRFAKEERKAILDHLMDFYKLHIDRLQDINAHEILREVWG